MDIEDGTQEKHPHCCSTFWLPLSPQFGGYRIYHAGGSFWAPTWVLLAFRSLVIVALLSVLIWASIVGKTFLIVATSVWLPCVLLLTACSALYLFDVSSPALKILANITVPLYQSMVSLTAFVYPMFILLAGRAGYVGEDGFGFIPAVIFATAVIVLILLDILAFGARMRFRIQVAWLPVLLDLFVFMVSVAILVYSASRIVPEATGNADTLEKILGTSNVGGAIALGVLYCIFWSAASAILSVIITRATDCCIPYVVATGDGEEDPFVSCMMNCRQGV